MNTIIKNIEDAHAMVSLQRGKQVRILAVLMYTGLLELRLLLW